MERKEGIDLVPNVKFCTVRRLETVLDKRNLLPRCEKMPIILKKNGKVITLQRENVIPPQLNSMIGIIFCDIMSGVVKDITYTYLVLNWPGLNCNDTT